MEKVHVTDINFKIELVGLKGYEFRTSELLFYPDAGHHGLFRIEKSDDGSVSILIASDEDYYVYDDVTGFIEEALGLTANELFSRFEGTPDVEDHTDQFLGYFSDLSVQ
jgi:hypothetical protein